MEEKCDYCGIVFDSDSEGHYDESTGLFFCWAECEMNYDREIGLPNSYVLPAT